MNTTESSDHLGLPAKVYNDALEEVIKGHFGWCHKQCNIEVGSATGPGENYAGEVFRVTVRHESEGERSLVVKLPPQNLVRRNHMVSRPGFVREFEFFETILPMLTEFQKEKGIDVEKDGFYEVPKCFKALNEEPFEGFFLEDLNASGFEMYSRLKVLTADHVIRVMEVLGKFHAISFAMKDQRTEVFEPFKATVDILFLRDENALAAYAAYFDSVKKQAFGVFGADENRELVERAQKSLATEYPDLMRTCVTGEPAEPYAVICHGDCWNNNVMYRYEKGVPVECRFIDWQTVRYASPVSDVVYYIFLCTTKELRDQHYDDFLDAYYSSLSSFLIRLGSDPLKVFPRDVFNDHLKKFGRFGLMSSILVLPMVTSNPEDCPDLDEASEKTQKSGRVFDEDIWHYTSSKTVDAYAKRMGGVFQDMYDLGYI